MNAIKELEKRLEKIKELIEEIGDSAGEEMEDEISEGVDKVVEQFQEKGEKWNYHVGDLILQLVANVSDSRLRPVLVKFAEELKNPRMKRSALGDIVALA